MITIYPPYHGDFGDQYANQSGSGNFIPYLEHVENESIGSVYAFNHNQIKEPGDYARLITEAFSGMTFLFRMPSSGRLSVVSTLRANRSFVQGYLDPEFWGTSSAAITQGANYSMWVPPNFEVDGITHNMLYYTRGDDDGLWEIEFAYDGEIREYGLVSQRRFNAGDWVLLSARVDAFQDATVNDMNFKGYLINSWIITKLVVDGVP